MLNKKSDGSSFFVPASFASDPVKTEVWLEKRAKEIISGQGTPVPSIGGHMSYMLPDGKPLVTRPDLALGKIKDALFSLITANGSTLSRIPVSA